MVALRYITAIKRELIARVDYYENIAEINGCRSEM